MDCGAPLCHKIDVFWWKGEKCWGNRHLAKSILFSRAVKSLWAVRSILANCRWQGACDESSKKISKEEDRKAGEKESWDKTQPWSWAHGCGAVPSVQLSESTWMSNAVRSAVSELRCRVETVVKRCRMGAGIKHSQRKKKNRPISRCCEKKKTWIFIWNKRSSYADVSGRPASAATGSMCCSISSVGRTIKVSGHETLKILNHSMSNRNKGPGPKPRAGGWGDQDENKWSKPLHPIGLHSCCFMTLPLSQHGNKCLC